MPAQLGSLSRHDDLVSLSRPDLVVTSGTPVGLLCLVRLNMADVDVLGKRHRALGLCTIAHSTGTATINAVATMIRASIHASPLSTARARSRLPSTSRRYRLPQHRPGRTLPVGR